MGCFGTIRITKRETQITVFPDNESVKQTMTMGDFT